MANWLAAEMFGMQNDVRTRFAGDVIFEMAFSVGMAQHLSAKLGPDFGRIHGAQIGGTTIRVVERPPTIEPDPLTTEVDCVLVDSGRPMQGCVHGGDDWVDGFFESLSF